MKTGDEEVQKKSEGKQDKNMVDNTEEAVENGEKNEKVEEKQYKKI